jgi:mono/diheme cytochrome c family protein
MLPVLITALSTASAPPEAEALFVVKCASCHTVGQGDRVGPDLKGVVGRRDRVWLTHMIQAPSTLLGADADARALLAKYNDVRMPDLGLSDPEVTALVSLLEYCSAEACTLKGKFDPVTKASPADIAMGQSLFVGEVRLGSGGPACIACHRADGAESLMGGGTLAKDLTHVFGKFGDEGLDAALRSPGFKVMKQVFADHPLQSSESFALRAFLDRANRGTALEDHSERAPLSMPLAGTLGALGALGALNALWGQRKQGMRRPLLARKEPE